MNDVAQMDAGTQSVGLAERAGAPRHIVWHLGFQKTGTTTFQRMLTENAQVLGEYMAWVTPADRSAFMKWVDDRYHRPGRLLRAPGLRRAIMLYALRQMLRPPMQAGKPCVLVSDEMLVARNLYSGDRHIFEDAADKIAMLSDLGKPATSHFVFYTRDFDKWLDSAWRQGVRYNRIRQTRDAWMAGVPFERDWAPHRAQLEAAAENAGATIAFHTAADDRTAGQLHGGAILRACGIPDEVISSLVQPSNENVGLSLAASEFLAMMNALGVPQHHRWKVRRLVETRQDLFLPDDRFEALRSKP